MTERDRERAYSAKIGKKEQKNLYNYYASSFSFPLALFFSFSIQHIYFAYVCMIIAALRSRLSILPHRFVYSAHTMSFTKPYSYVQDSELAKLWKEKDKNPNSIAIVDVRDDDFEGGNIPGCLHIPSSVFTDKVDELVQSPIKDGENLVSCGRSSRTSFLWY